MLIKPKQIQKYIRKELNYSVQKNQDEFEQLKAEIAALKRSTQAAAAARIPFEPETEPEEPKPIVAKRQAWPPNYPKFSMYVIETKMSPEAGATLSRVGEFVYDQPESECDGCPARAAS